MNIVVRPFRSTDLSFVFDSWLLSWRKSKWAGTVPNHLYFNVQRELIEDLIARGAKVFICCPDTHLDLILGWACAEEKEGQTVLHYVYVKDAYKTYPIFSDLIDALPGLKPGLYTHQLNKKELVNWKWIPEIARRKDL